MSKISKLGISIGQIIRAEHLLRIINALSGEVPNTQIEISGSVTASFFVGNGSQLTNLPTGSGGGTPGGSNTQIQFNSGSTFSGSANFRYNYANQSLAQGENVTISGSYSHAEGYNTQALGLYSHAEGIGTTTSGQGSHTEGNTTTAGGNYSHAEGGFTSALGVSSHAEGAFTEALGDYSHTEGRSTIASASYQTVVGQYNAQNNTTDRFIVGTGTSATRRDGFAVTHSGSIKVLTQSAAPAWTGREGEIVPANDSGTYRIYVYIGGAWRSASLS
jgi:hypothetical protein